MFTAKEEKNQALFDAINQEDSDEQIILENIQIALTNGADINAQTLHYGQTILHIAAKGGNLALVKFALDKKVDVDIQSSIGQTACHIAIEANNIEIFKLLVNVTNMKISAPIYIEDCYNGRCNSYGGTLFHTAIERENLHACNILFAMNANVRAVTHDHFYRAIDIVANEKLPKSLQWLLEKGVINVSSQRDVLFQKICNYDSTIQYLSDNGNDSLDFFSLPSEDQVLECIRVLKTFGVKNEGHIEQRSTSKDVQGRLKAYNETEVNELFCAQNRIPVEVQQRTARAEYSLKIIQEKFSDNVFSDLEKKVGNSIKDDVERSRPLSTCIPTTTPTTLQEISIEYMKNNIDEIVSLYTKT